MLLRIRWFLFGVVGTIAGAAYAGAKLRRARSRLTPRALAESGRHSVAGLLERTADRIDPPAPTAR